MTTRATKDRLRAWILGIGLGSTFVAWWLAEVSHIFQPSRGIVKYIAPFACLGLMVAALGLLELWLRFRRSHR